MLKINSILFVETRFSLRKYQNFSFCKECSILSHSVDISNCLSLILSTLFLSYFELFKNNAFINSAFVKGIFPILILVKMAIESFSLLSYHITFVSNLNFDSKSLMLKSGWSNQLHTALYASEI